MLYQVIKHVQQDWCLRLHPVSRRVHPHPLLVAPFPKHWPRCEWCDRPTQNEECQRCQIYVCTPCRLGGLKCNCSYQSLFVTDADEEVKLRALQHLLPWHWPHCNRCDRRTKNEACQTCSMRVSRTCLLVGYWCKCCYQSLVDHAADEAPIQGTPVPGLQHLAQEPQTQHIVVSKWPLSDIARYADIMRIAREMAVPMVLLDSVVNFSFLWEFWDVVFRDVNVRRPWPEGCQVFSRTPNARCGRRREGRAGLEVMTAALFLVTTDGAQTGSWENATGGVTESDVFVLASRLLAKVLQGAFGQLYEAWPTPMRSFSSRLPSGYGAFGHHGARRDLRSSPRRQQSRQTQRQWQPRGPGLGPYG